MPRSIFVNPTQFNDATDFEKYPVTSAQILMHWRKPVVMCSFPTFRHEIYPNGTGHLPQYELGYLETVLEGKYRPGHFRAYAVGGDRCWILYNRMPLFWDRKIFSNAWSSKNWWSFGYIYEYGGGCLCNLREAGGLAMSSRNMRLTACRKRESSIDLTNAQLYQSSLI